MVVASIPSPDLEWSSFSIGPLTIHVYALCVLAGIIAAMYISSRRLAKRGVDPEVVYDFAFWAVLLGLVGARFYHVFTHPGDYFYPGANLWDVFAIWDGGNAIYGSLIGGAIGVFIACRRVGIRFVSLADAAVPGLLAAQAIGRLGNYVNQELFGRPTTLPWGLEISPEAAMYPAGVPVGTLFHPLFLYEMLWNLLGIAVILLVTRAIRLDWGRTFALYMIWYGLGRSWLELLRLDPTSSAPLGLPINTWMSLLVVIAGVVILMIQTRRHPEPEPSPYLPGREPAETEKADKEA